MQKKAICFSKKGTEVIERINRACAARGIRGTDAFIDREGEEEIPGFTRVTGSVHTWAEQHFIPGNALIFVGATGIAVRALTGLPKDKLTDCPVIVIDDNGGFVIPILSGHAGGANKLAVLLAELLEAIPVITTSTDVNDTFSVDTFAAENRLTVADRAGIKKVSAKAIEGKAVTISVKNYPPDQPVDVIVADETDAECQLLLKPKRYTVGLGMKKGKDQAELERFFLETLRENDLTTEDIYALCTLDIKEEEPALTALRDKYRIPVISFDRELLMKAPGDFTASEFVEKTVGVDNVCERVAVLGAGSGAEIVLRKKAADGMTIAIARRR
ncbi:MAG: cobalamin biosynthesis protein [Lachnospiraceae bacterium]|nr:cobalamin biosynthesis protein [Lachnospiraceae bacterium]